MNHMDNGILVCLLFQPQPREGTRVELLARMQYMEGNISQTMDQIKILHSHFQRVNHRVAYYSTIHLIESIR